MLRKTLKNLPYSQPYLITTVVAVVIFFPTWLRLFSKWLEFEQVLAHGLATGIIFLVLLVVHPPLYHKRGETSSHQYFFTGALALVGTVVFWSLLELIRIDTLAFLMLPVGMAAVSWVLLGVARTRAFLPYIFLLSLSLPIWTDLIPALVALASAVVGTWVRWFGMTALIEGNSITLPYGRLLIADGCSGIRYFAISILLAMMTSILNDYRLRGWVTSIAVAMFLALLANWVRITILVAVAYETNMESELLTDHEAMGWIVFGLFLLPALYFSPVRRRSADNELPLQTAKIHRPGLVAVVAAIVIGPLALTLSQSSVRPEPAWALSIPQLKSSQSQNLPLPITLPNTLEEDIWTSGDVWISLAQKQRRGASDKLVPYLPTPYDSSTWHVVEQLSPGLKLYRNILTRERVLMVQWYQVGSRQSWNYREAKLLQIPATLGGETRFALVTLQIPCKNRDCQKVAGRLEDEMAKVSQNLKPKG